MALEAAIESRCARRDKDACRRGVLFTCPHPRLLRAQCVSFLQPVQKRRPLLEGSRGDQKAPKDVIFEFLRSNEERVLLVGQLGSTKLSHYTGTGSNI